MEELQASGVKVDNRIQEANGEELKEMKMREVEEKTRELEQQTHPAPLERSAAARSLFCR